MRRVVSRIIRRFNHICCFWNYKRQGVTFAHHSSFYQSTFGPHSNLAHHAEVNYSSIGLRTSIGRYTKVQFADVGKYCSISWDVTIGALSHSLHAVTSHSFPIQKRFRLCEKDRPAKRERTVIGNDVWIGCGSIIKQGVHIGDGAVIGAGTVVTHDVEPYEIVVGIPATHLKWRFDEKIRKTLIDIKWWDWEDDLIRAHIGLFSPKNDITISTEILEKLKMINEARIP